MKILAASLLISSICIGASAQETTETPPKRQPGKNEMGVFAEPIASNGNNNNYYSHTGYGGNLGLQYKRWAKPNIAYRVMGAVGNYSQNSFFDNSEKRGDTLLQRYADTHVPMYFIGAGVEVQRHFYKKVTLYAAVELKAGYGTGQYEETLTKSLESQQGGYYPNYYFDVTNVRRDQATAFTIDVSPFIGAKLNFRRISLGTEVSVIKLGIESLQYETLPSYGITNFAVGDFRQRIYMNYRF